MVRTKQQRRRNRRLPDRAVQPTIATAIVTGVLHGSSEATVSFNSPVQVDPSALPTTWTFGTNNRTITSIVGALPTAITFGLSGAVAAAEPYVIGGNDPTARTPQGGYVQASVGVMT